MFLARIQCYLISKETSTKIVAEGQNNKWDEIRSLAQCVLEKIKRIDPNLGLGKERTKLLNSMVQEFDTSVAKISSNSYSQDVVKIRSSVYVEATIASVKEIEKVIKVVMKWIAAVKSEEIILPHEDRQQLQTILDMLTPEIALNQELFFNLFSRLGMLLTHVSVIDNEDIKKAEAQLIYELNTIEGNNQLSGYAGFKFAVRGFLTQRAFEGLSFHSSHNGKSLDAITASKIGQSFSRCCGNSYL